MKPIFHTRASHSLDSACWWWPVGIAITPSCANGFLEGLIDLYGMTTRPRVRTATAFVVSSSSPMVLSDWSAGRQGSIFTMRKMQQGLWIGSG